ncbi:unnamed protein product [Pedinophyceae sp. YPF-701]|nr:unnamed protein product [Pedinophyceae sp. YPF-701]
MDSADGTEFPAADGLYGVDTLDPDMVWPVGAVHYYRELIAHLKSKGYVAGKDLYGCPYDFRQSNRLQAQLDRLQARLEGAVRRSGGRRASVVSHSMGGLLVKCLLAERPQVFERLVGKWITIATPFRGAPGVACDAILSGVEVSGPADAGRAPAVLGQRSACARRVEST